MGGQLIKGYALEGDSQGQAGLTKSWKLYRGHKAQTHVLASIFLIEKKQLKKNDREQTIKLAKKEASHLLRVRHPGVLAVVEPLTEDENILAFVTERVEGSISQLIKNGKFAEFLNSQLQLKLYLYPFLQALSFIHDSLKQAHLAINPQNVYVTPEGKWKIAGFGVNQQLTGQDKQATQQKFYDYSYSAPELASSNQFSKKSDIFSLGVFIVKILQFIHKEQRPLVITDRNQYEKASIELKKLINSPVIGKSSHSNDLQQLLRSLLDWQGERRMNISQILGSRWMNDSTLVTVKYLDKISNYQNKQQLQFLKGLAGVLDDFDARVLSRIVMPKLIDLLKFNHLIASVAYIIIDLLKKGKLSNDQFNKLVWPALKGIMQGKEMTAQAIYLFVLNYQILQKFIGEADSITFLLPLYIKCFDCPPKLKQLALRSLQRISKKLDYQNFKTRVMPKLLNLFKDPSIDIRKDALRGLYGILKTIDAQTISLSVLPAIQNARKAGSDPFVNAIINAIYNHLSLSLSSDVLCSKILPVLIPYLSQPSISKNEFYQFKSTIMNMINIIEKQRQKSFGNSISTEDSVFTQADFKFKDEDTKVQPQVKGNYSFLANYIQAKPDNQNISPPGNTGISISPASNPGIANTPNIPALSYTPANLSQNINNPIEPINVPIPVIQPKETIEIKATNLPLPAVTINPPPSINFPIKTQLPQQSNQPMTFNFGSLGNYQPLDLSYAVQNTPTLPFQKSVSAPTKKIQQKIEPPKIPKNPPVLQSKDSSKPSPQIKKQSKFIGGASGPMQIKKIIGPGQKIKPPVKQEQKYQNNNLDMNYFSNLAPEKQQTPAFSINFDSFNLGSNSNPSPVMQLQTANNSDQFASKPQPPQFSFDFGGSLNAKSDPNNPFAEIESGLGTSVSNDIYSYFQQEKKTKSNNSADLI